MSDDGMSWQDKMREFAQAERDLEVREAKKAPEANKLMKVLQGSLADYRMHYAGNTKSGARVMFCVSDWPNAVGYFLCWCETWPSGKRFVRTRWSAHESHKEALGQAERLVDEWRVSHQTKGVEP